MSNIPNCQFKTLCEQLGKPNIFSAYVPLIIVFYLFLLLYSLLFVVNKTRAEIQIISNLVPESRKVLCLITELPNRHARWAFR